MLLFLIKFVPESKTDVVPINITGTGNLFPEEDCSLIMTNANVIFDINNLVSSNKIDVNFNGNYTIYNPNESRNVTIAAPFSLEFENIEANCIIKVETNVVPFSFVHLHWSDPWIEYLDSVGLGMSDKRNFILTNITFPENSSVKIEYSFNAYITHTDIDGELTIYYDVGTSRAWNGSINERVEFKTYGKLPDSYSLYGPSLNNYNCTVSNFSNGRIYTWEWVDEIIIIDSVYISYHYNYPYFWLRMTPIIIFGSVFGIVIIIGVITKLVNKKKKRIRIDTGNDDTS